jgi:hypothetical protein
MLEIEEAQRKFKRHEDGNLHQYTVKAGTGLFHCQCGCNVFHKYEDDDEIFICNCCNAEYSGE